MRNSLLILGFALLVACDDAGTGPKVDEYLSGPVSLAVVSGDLQADTIQATLGTPIIVELKTDEESPKTISGALVNFVVLENGCGEPYAGSALTDASGRAAEVWKLGTKPGTCTMEARAVKSDGTPVVYSRVEATVGPGKPATVQIETSTASAWVGSTIDLAALVKVEDRVGNSIAIAPQITGATTGITASSLGLTASMEVEAIVGLDFGTVQTSEDGVTVAWISDLREGAWEASFSCSDYSTPGEAPDSVSVVMVRDSVSYDYFPKAGTLIVPIRSWWSGTETEYWPGGRVEVLSVSHVERSAQAAGALTLENGRGVAVANAPNPSEYMGGNWCVFQIARWDDWAHTSPVRFVRR